MNQIGIKNNLNHYYKYYKYYKYIKFLQKENTDEI